MESRKTSNLLIIGFLLVAYVSIQIYCINQLSPNYDEGSFAAYGTTLLKFQRQKDVVAFESKLPITALNMIPRAVEQVIKPGLTKAWPESQSDIIHGRYISLLFSVLLGLLIFSWTSKLYNAQTALFVLITYLMCPNFLAHGIFVSSDIFACFFMTAALYCLWLFFQRIQTRHFLLMSAATGLAEISKFSMVHLLILIPLLLVSQLYQPNVRGVKRWRIKPFIGYLTLFFVINWLIICAGHLFYQVFTPISHYSFRSDTFKSVQAFFNSSLPGFPVPIPSSYVQSMDAVVYFDHLGGGVPGSLNGAPYMLGRTGVHGLWYYYLVAIFLKVPIPILILWLVSIVVTFSTFSKKAFLENDILMLLPIIYFLVYMSVFYSTQVGIRHILIIFPLLMVLSGKLISRIFASKRGVILWILIAYEGISVLSYFPHFLPYTNEFIIDKKMAYRKIADTNLCYGEGKKFLNRYLAKHPEAMYMPEKPVTGYAVFEVNEMLNRDMATVHKYDWAAKLTPIDHIHSQYLVFRVNEETTDSIRKRR